MYKAHCHQTLADKDYEDNLVSANMRMEQAWLSTTNVAVSVPPPCSTSLSFGTLIIVPITIYPEQTDNKGMM